MEKEDSVNDPVRTLRIYIQEHRKFRIPAYQRGFKWGKTNSKNSEGDVYKLMSDLTIAFGNEQRTEYFIQGITVCVADDQVVEIIDGQQRTTFFYLLFCYLFHRGDTEAGKVLADFEIDYCGRKDSMKFLQNLKNPEQVELALKPIKENEQCKQDIFYFRKALITMDGFSSAFTQVFTQSLLDKVKLIYTEVKTVQARRVFSMMNQGKAYMKAPELIKATFLSMASRQGSTEELKQKCENDYSLEWEINEVRSRFAREWNEWEQWWRSQKVDMIFGHNDIDFLLFLYYKNHTQMAKPFKWSMQISGHEEEIEKYNIFKEEFLSAKKINYKDVSGKQAAKLCFQQLRNLQQQLEQVVGNGKTYNYLALILNIANSTNRDELLNHYREKSWEIIRDDIRYFLVDPDVKLNDIKNGLDISDKAHLLIHRLNDKYVYDKGVKDIIGNQVNGAYEEMCRVLLWLNVEEEVNLAGKSDINRYFNFKIWESNQRTLEHIYPKIWSTNLDFTKPEIEDQYRYLTVHSAGNLVLLYQSDNAEFGAKMPSVKKEIYFNFSSEFKSRHLMHSIMVFAKRDNWKEKEIIDNQKEFIDRLVNLFFGTPDKYETYKQSLTT